jgi:hypothetical protein
MRRFAALATLLSLSVTALPASAAGKPAATAHASARANSQATASTRLANARSTAPAPQKQLTITVLWDDAMTSRESGLWIGYLFARMEFVSRNGGRYSRVPGVITPIFDEEVFARSEAAKIYRELRSKGRGTDSAYFNDLEKVDSAGFMREYVWQYLRRDTWSVAPEALRNSDFERWARSNLGQHAVETRGRVAFQTGTTAGS